MKEQESNDRWCFMYFNTGKKRKKYKLSQFEQPLWPLEYRFFASPSKTISFCFSFLFPDLQVVTKSPAEIPRLREVSTRQGRHLCLQLNGPSGVGATALQYISRTNQLAVGFSDGYLQLWNMKALKKEWVFVFLLTSVCHESLKVLWVSVLDSL